MAPSAPFISPHIVAAMSSEEIAQRLRQDEALVNEDKPCSGAVLYLSSLSAEQHSAIAAHLAPVPNLSRLIKMTIFENLTKKLKRHVEQGYSSSVSNWTPPVSDLPELAEGLNRSALLVALEVLTALSKSSIISEDTTAKSIRTWLKQQTTLQTSAVDDRDVNFLPDTETPASIPTLASVPSKRRCYVCRLTITNPHPSQPFMCTPCGAFNMASSLLSTPLKLSLSSDFTVLITGARINLGYHTALRLLRCGARVIATTRYPRDAESRYLSESDAAGWKERLKVIGADFRCAADAFTLVADTKRCLRDWGEMKLRVLVNNAAQTLTDSVKKERGAVKREETLRNINDGKTTLIEGAYEARVRGGGGGALPLALEAANRKPVSHFAIEGVDDTTRTVEASNVPNNFVTELEADSSNDKSSWVQSLFEIPYEDVISAHAVNTFVPLILCRELLPLMGNVDCMDDINKTPTKPHGYIINVSSREGIFEDRIDSTAKRGKHVHTNMSKAALNMITETEAEVAWKSRRVAMNTVDPGYMSAAPEFEDAFGGARPLGWEDGAGRVLWPVAVGEKDGTAIWGRFLKHYGAVSVDPSGGR